MRTLGRPAVHRDPARGVAGESVTSAPLHGEAVAVAAPVPAVHVVAGVIMGAEVR